MVLFSIILFVVGGALLVGGAEFLVRGASRLALGLGISPLVVGLTVVAFGTSAPEFAVSVGSSLSGQSDVALGNVVGSNVFNVLFILGVSALVAPLIVNARLVVLDVPLMIGASVFAFVLALDGRIGRFDGALLFASLLAYTAFLVWQSKKDRLKLGSDAMKNSKPPSRRDWALNLTFVLLGLGLLVWGANWVVRGAVDFARAFGVSELVIGLTIVAAGTSLPEVATSVLATLRGERDIAVGNVVGSNLFNLLGVLGLAGLVSPIGIPVGNGVLSFDLPVMVVVAFACLPVFFTGHLIARWEGGLFLAYYVVYVSYLILHATDHPGLEDLRTALVWFVMPLTAITLLVVVVRQLRRRVPRAPEQA